MEKNYEGKFSAPTTPVKPRRKKKFRFKKFAKKVCRNRFVQIVAATFVVVAISRGFQYHEDKIKYTELMELQEKQIVTQYEEEMEIMRLEHQREIEDVRAEYEILTPEEQIRQEAEYIAKVLYGTARNNSERDQRTVVWCILNRVDSSGYPNTVKGVCQQTSQWMGYSDDNPILNELFEVAMKELETWHNNYRPVGLEYVYMSWSSKEVILRNTYEKKANTQYWQAG